MSLYFLDTNIVSQFVRDKAPLRTVQRLNRMPAGNICVSIVTRAEILYGRAKAGHPPRLTNSINIFFQTAEVRDWDEKAAHAYAALRTETESQGIGIAPLDLMIAAQGLAAGAILVTNDSALKRLTPWLPVEDWTL